MRARRLPDFGYNLRTLRLRAGLTQAQLAAGARCTDYRGTTLIDGEGHWIQQEAPDAVNRALLEFLAGLG